MTKDKNLGTFRVAEMRRPEVRAGGRATEKEAAQASPSVGFPAVEHWLETGTIDSLAEALRPTYEQLEHLAEKGDMKNKAAAKKAMGAYERTADLFEYLFSTKAALQSKG